MQVYFQRDGHMSRVIEELDGNVLEHGAEMIEAQCLPLISLLMAANLTTIDYFSLDVEGKDLSVLKSIPWHNVDIKVRNTRRRYKELIKFPIKQSFMEILYFGVN